MATFNLKFGQTLNMTGAGDPYTVILPTGYDSATPTGARNISPTELVVTFEPPAGQDLYNATTGELLKTLTVTIAPNRSALFIYRPTMGWVLFDETDLVMRWRGVWDDSKTYQRGEVVRDGEWLMIANTTTTDRAAPQLTNNPEWDLPDAPAWVTNQNQSVVQSGREWEVMSPVVIKGYEIWGLDDSVNTTYHVFTYLHPTGSPQDIQFTQLADPAINPGGWQIAGAVNYLLVAGQTIGIILEAVTATSTTQVTGTWRRQDNGNNENQPDPQYWRTRDNEANIRISNTDTSSNDRSAELMTIGAGSVITIVDGNDANRWMVWRINAAPEQLTTSVIWRDVTYEGNGPNGEPVVGCFCAITADIPAIGQTEYVQLAGGNPGASTRGLLAFDGVAQAGVENDAFGVRILFDEYVASPDWDVVAVS